MRVGQAALAALLLLVAARAEGQGQRRQRIPASAEWRIEGVAGRDAALVTGAGFHVGLIPSVRAGLSAATGVRFGEDGGRSASRGDLLVRFLLDPYRQSRYGISIGGGAALSNVQDGDWRPYLTMMLDVEGPRRGRVAPAIQVGVGGGVRVAVALRTASQSWR